MKKVTLLVSLLFMTFVAWADPVVSGTSKITLSTAGQPDKELSIVISSSFSDDFDNTYDAEAANPGGVYIYSGGERYSTWASNAYTPGLALGVGAVAGNTSYTLSFSNFTGSSYKIYDWVAYKVIEVNGSTPDYVFTTSDYAVDTEIYDRFVINQSMTTEDLKTCFTGSVLQILENPIFGAITVKWVKAGAQSHAFAYGTTEIDLTDTTYFPSDVDDYVIEFGSGAAMRSFKVTVER